jgi:hypothetical protein
MNDVPKTSWMDKIEFPTHLVCAEDRALMRAILSGLGVAIVAFVPHWEVKAILGAIILGIIFILSMVEFGSERSARQRQLKYANVLPWGQHFEVVVEGVKYRTPDGKMWCSPEGKTLSWDLTNKLTKIVAVQKVWPGS